MKKCYKCGLEKLEINFCKNKSKKDGLATECKLCVKQINKQLREINGEQIKSKKQEYAQNNKEQIKKYKKEYYENNKEKIKQHQDNYNHMHRKERNELSNKYQKVRRKYDLSYRVKTNISRAISKKLKLLGFYKNNMPCMKYLGYTRLELKEHLEKQFEYWMSWNNYGQYNSKTWNDNDQKTWTWQLDHIIPHSIFNYTSMNDLAFKECWTLTNLRPYSAKQNVIDGNRR